MASVVWRLARASSHLPSSTSVMTAAEASKYRCGMRGRRAGTAARPTGRRRPRCPAPPADPYCRSRRAPPSSRRGRSANRGRTAPVSPAPAAASRPASSRRRRAAAAWAPQRQREQRAHQHRPPRWQRRGGALLRLADAARGVAGFLDRRQQLGHGHRRQHRDRRAFGGQVHRRREHAGQLQQRLLDAGDAGCAGHALDLQRRLVGGDLVAGLVDRGRQRAGPYRRRRLHGGALVARLMLACATPGTALSAFSTRATQEAQVMPATWSCRAGAGDGYSWLRCTGSAGQKVAHRRPSHGGKVKRRCAETTPGARRSAAGGLTFQRWEAPQICSHVLPLTPGSQKMIAFEVQDMTCGHCVSSVTKAVLRSTPPRR